jgi:hypothetical protein
LLSSPKGVHRAFASPARIHSNDLPERDARRPVFVELDLEFDAIAFGEDADDRGIDDAAVVKIYFAAVFVNTPPNYWPL